MGSELKNMVTATDINTRYDASAKRLLGNKNILAHILIKTVKEFKGMRPGEVADLERDFKNSKYNDIKRVYSIWVCMNMKENILSHVHLTKDDIIGEYEWKGRLDLFNIVLIGLSKKLPENNAIYELHRLLGALLSQELTVDERLTIIGKEYDITVEDKFREEVSNMCNLSQGIEERGFERGIEQGVKQGIEQGVKQGRVEGRAEGIEEGRIEAEAKIIIKMYNKGFTVEEIAETTDKKIEEVTAIIEGIEPVIV